MSNTQYSSQYVLNSLYGSATSTQYSEQEVANLFVGSPSRTSLSLQAILNRNLSQPDTAMSEQVALWNILKTPLSITGSSASTSYSPQELLNLALENAVSLTTILGSGTPAPPPASTAGEPLGLLLTLTKSS
jgi:hypothetical protein